MSRRKENRELRRSYKQDKKYWRDNMLKDHEIDKAIDRILHEFKIFSYIWQWYCNSFHGFIGCDHKHTEEESDVHFDSYMLHYRNIYDFFKGKKYSTDIDCTDFGFKCPEILYVEHDIKIKIDRLIHHITDYYYEKYDWLITNILESVLHPMIRFIEHLISKCMITDEVNKKLAEELLHDLKVHPTIIVWDTPVTRHKV